MSRDLCFRRGPPRDPHSRLGKASVAVGIGAGRDLGQMYAIYGSDEWQAVGLLCVNAVAFACAAVLLLLRLDHLVAIASASPLLAAAPLPALRLAAGLAGLTAAVTAACLLREAASVLRSSLTLRWDVALRMVAAVPDWSGVRTALDVGCGRGILLNAVALRLKKQGSSGRVVGLDRHRDSAIAALRRAALEGVQEYVTCREGDARALPFPDSYFDVVVSGTGEAAAAVAEIVRVLRPGGAGVVWDLPELAARLRELRMDDVRVSERVADYTAGSHIVSFRKPPYVAADDRTANIC